MVVELWPRAPVLGQLAPGCLVLIRGSLATSQLQRGKGLAPSPSHWVQRRSLALGEEEGKPCYYFCLTISA